MCDPAMPKIIQNHEEWKQITELVRGKFVLYDQSSDDSSISSSLKQTPNIGFERTGAVTDGMGKGGKRTAMCMHQYNQKYSQFRMSLWANRVHTLLLCPRG